MAFQGVKDNHGQFMQLAMMLMDRKRQADQDKLAAKQSEAKAVQSAAKWALEMEGAKLDNAKKHAELRASLDSASGDVAPFLEAASSPVPANVMAMPVEARQRSPEILSRQAAADAAIGRLNQIGGTREGVLREPTRVAATSAGLGANPLVARERVRAESAGKVEERVASTKGDVQSATWVRKNIRDLRRSIRTAESAGEDASGLRDELAAYEQVSENLSNKGKLTVMNPPSPNLIEKWQSAMASDENAIGVVDRLVSGLDSGEISAGAVGTARFYAEGVQNLLSDLSSVAPVEGRGAEQFENMVRQANSGMSGIVFENSNGEQMTLDLDAMTLAWQYARANRDSARITMLEFEKSLKLLAPTGAFRSERQFRSALAKVAAVTLKRARKRERVIESMPGISPGLMGALKFDPSVNEEDQAYLENIRGNRAPRVDRPSKDAGTTKLRLQDATPENSDDEVLDAIMRELKAGAN